MNKKNKFIVIFCLCVVSIVFICSAFIYGFLQLSKDTGHASSMYTLGATMNVKLLHYHEKHGKYPDSLDEIQLTEVDIPKNISRDEMKKITYKTDGTSFTLQWNHPEYGFEIRK